MLSVCCFFFQAEDGIRDYKVTGVQTCALPISMRANPGIHSMLEIVVGSPTPMKSGPCGPIPRPHTANPANPAPRSEERRVGKECRERWPQHYQNKTKEKYYERREKETREKSTR